MDVADVVGEGVAWRIRRTSWKAQPSGKYAPRSEFEQTSWRRCWIIDDPGCGMRVDDVGRRIAASSPGALLWQQVAVEIIREPQKVPVIPPLPDFPA